MLRAVLLSSKAGRVCGLFSTMVGLTKGIASWFSGRRRSKRDGFGLKLPCAGVKYSRLEDISEHNEGSLYCPGGDTIEVKQNEVCSEVLKRLSADDKVNTIVALSGDRGIGKSFLLKRLEHEALESGNFSIVLRVSATDGVGDLWDKLMKAFNDKYGLVVKNDIPNRDRPYLILLDDLVRPITISSSLFPFDTVEKIVFTTEGHDLGCLTLEVLPLDGKEAWDFFQKELKEEASLILDSEVMKLAAVKMVEECKGLPLALKLLAGAVKGKSSLEDLKKDGISLNNPKQLLSFALSSLESPTMEQCFLYIAMFPINYWISEDLLIEYWNGEGLISNIDDDVVGASDYSHEVIEKNEPQDVTQMWKAEDVIERLKRANLLEERITSRANMDKAVRMLNTLRDVVLSDHHEFLNQSNFGLKKAPTIKKWTTARRVSLMFNDIEELKEKLNCGQLETLLLNQNYNLIALGKSFLDSMKVLKVLDLSHTGLNELPHSIGSMVSLQYLNLTFSGIRVLPEALGNLKKLKCLRLEGAYINYIPPKLFSNMVALETLHMLNTGFELTEDNYYVIEEMDNLKNLRMVGISVKGVNCLTKLATTKKVIHILANLLITGVLEFEADSTSVPFSVDVLSTFGFLQNLRNLSICHFYNLDKLTVQYGNILLAGLETLEIRCHHQLESFEATKFCRLSFRNLCTLKIVDCPLLKDISWAQCLPNLVDLVLHDNDGMTILFENSMDESEICLPQLRFLTLGHLSSLRLISDSVLLPSLETLVIYECPKLDTLGSNVLIENLKTIKCTRKWWKFASETMDMATSFGKARTHFINRLLSFDL